MAFSLSALYAFSGGRQRGHSRIFRAWVWIWGDCYIATTISSWLGGWGVGWGLCVSHITSHRPTHAVAHLNEENRNSGNQSVVSHRAGKAAKQVLKKAARVKRFRAYKVSLALKERNECVAISVITAFFPQNPRCPVLCQFQVPSTQITKQSDKRKRYP